MSVQLPENLLLTLPRPVFMRRLIVTSVLAVSVSIAVAGYMLAVSRRHYQERAESLTQNLALALSGQISVAVEDIDLTVRTVVDEVQRELAGGGIDAQGLNKFIARHRERLPGLNGLRVVSPEGENLYGTDINPHERTFIADRAYFIRLRQDPQAGLVISEPVIGRVSKQWSIILARRVESPVGTFAGVVYGAITLDQFLKTFSSINTGRRGAVTLRDGELALIARYPAPADFSGVAGQKNASPELQAWWALKQESFTYRTGRSFDAVDRTYTCRKVPNRPLYVVVGLACEEYFAGWWLEVVEVMALAALCIASILITSVMVHRNWRRRASAAEALLSQEKALRTSEELLRSITDNSADVIFVKDRECRFVFMNPAGCRLLGKTADQLLGRSKADFHRDPGEAAKFIADDRRIMDGGRMEIIEEDMVGADGIRRVFLTTKVPRLDGQGQVVGLIGIAHDITGRKQAEIAAHAASQYVRRLMEASLDPFVTIDAEGKISDANTAAEQVTGVPRDRLVGSEFPDYFTDPVKAREAYQQAFARGYITDFPLAIRHVTGRITSVLYNVSVYRDEQGNTLGVFAAARDVTERIRVESELQKMQRIQSLGKLAGGIAHDFNNIMMGLFGFINVALEGVDKDSPTAVALAEAERCRERAVRLTKQLLTFAKGGDPVLADVSLPTLISGVARFHLAGSNVLLVIKCARDLWPVLGDKGQIQQVISNLTINAREAMPDGGHLTITCENALLNAAVPPGLPEGRYVRISVQDEGGGIEPQNLEHIFDPYFTTKATGSGLGLTTAYSIVRKHRGHLGVESTCGRGSRFTVTLPAGVAAQSESVREPLQPQAAETGAVRILLLDDEAAIRTVVSKMLERFGYTVVTAATGQEAVSLYQAERERGTPISAVIMDLTISGGQGGKEAIKELLSIDPTVKAIVSSGYADDPVMANYADYGFRGVIEKPYSQDKLRQTLAQVLNG